MSFGRFLDAFGPRFEQTVADYRETLIGLAVHRFEQGLRNTPW